jgi:hypothetical protein
MIEIGKYNTLIILRDTKVGLFWYARDWPEEHDTQ